MESSVVANFFMPNYSIYQSVHKMAGIPFLNRYLASILNIISYNKVILEKSFRWRKTKIRHDKPRVYYGHGDLSKRKDLMSGGFVKVHDLAKRYPNTVDSPNILYLVSSALPQHVVAISKMARKAGISVVLNQNGVAYPGWHGPGWEQTNQPIRETRNLSDYVFYQSKFCIVSADKFLGSHSGPFSMLYNPVDTEKFKPIPFEQKSGNALKLLIAGSHWAFYRAHTAIDTLKILSDELKNIRLTIAGRLCWDKDERTCVVAIKRYAEKAGVKRRVDILGEYSQKQAPGLMADADVLLHPKYNDPCPRVVVEAMACGLPVVYSATGGVAELVGDKAGIGIDDPLDWEKIHPPRPERMAAAVAAIAKNLSQYSLEARLRATRRFRLEPWLEKHAKVFEMLVLDSRKR